MTDQESVHQIPVPEILWKRCDLERLFQLSGRSIARHVQAGNLPAPIIVGRSCRWRLSDIEEFLQGQSGTQTIECS